MNLCLQKRKSSLLISIFLVIGYALHGQMQLLPESILVHSKMSTDNGAVLDLIVFTKGQKQIRASIYPPNKTVGAVIAYDGEKVKIQEEVFDMLPTRILEAEEAAGNLFDLLALNPDYHFIERDGFDLKNPVFDGFRVETERETDPIIDTDYHRPISLRLYNAEKLIRSAEYESFFEQTDPYLQPKALTFTDETTGEEGNVVVSRFEYNVGLPDFLFELPDNF